MTTIAEALTLGLRHHQAGSLQQAEAIYRQILDVEPRQPDALHFLGVIAHQVGRNEDAIELMRRAISLAPFNPAFHSNLGLAYKAIGKLDDALASLREALRLQPDSAEANNNLGITLAAQRKTEEAAAWLKRALQLRPDYPEALNNLGNTLAAQGNFTEAVACLERALQVRPHYAEAHNNLGTTLQKLGKLQEAEMRFRTALQLNPHFAEAHNNLATIMLVSGRKDEAFAHYAQALHLKPDYADAHSNLATALQAQGNLDDAETHARAAVRLQPDMLGAHLNLGTIQMLQGELKQSQAAYREALRLDADYEEAHSNLLLCMNYDPDISAAALLAEHLGWGQRFGRVTNAGPAPDHDRESGRCLRVGYVSPDLNWHPIAYFLEPILQHHDPAQIEAICYAEVTAPDLMTERLQNLARGWRTIHGLTDEQAAELIRSDRIDILVDLAGHTAKSRLRIFAHKPAAVQVTYLGYPHSTGLPAMDYRLTDAIADPCDDDDDSGSEELIRLPGGFCCYAPLATAPEVGPSPVRQKGHVTFGSLHSLAKLNDGVLDLWCAILRAVPSAHLLVFRHTLQGHVADRLLRKLVQRGIDAGRVEMRHTVADGRTHMDTYYDVDISLDTFPWSGHTTACESLWMGVPVITLRDTRHAGRMVASVLTHAGLNEWIAETPEQYVALAVGLATDVEGLGKLREQLREMVRNSPLCNGKAFTRELEKAYREMWQRWCSSITVRPSAWLPRQ